MELNNLTQENILNLTQIYYLLNTYVYYLLNTYVNIRGMWDLVNSRNLMFKTGFQKYFGFSRIFEISGTVQKFLILFFPPIYNISIFNTGFSPKYATFLLFCFLSMVHWKKRLAAAAN